MTRKRIIILMVLVVVALSTGASPNHPIDAGPDVKSFGARGDGQSDDTVAIQTAINSLEKTGGSVNFPPGVYKVSASLKVPERVVLKGAGMLSSTVTYGGPGYAIALGSASAKALVYGTGVSDMGVQLTNTNSNGIALQCTAGAVLTNVYLQGVVPNASTGVFLDGGTIANQFTALTNVFINHMKYGYRLGTTGTGTVTSVVATNITSFGDTIYQSKGSVGIQIDENQGQGSRFYGGNLESCTYGILGKGAYVMIDGMRFEGNETDVLLDKSAAAWLITGCMGLDKVTDNSSRGIITNSFTSNMEPRDNQLRGRVDSAGPFRVGDGAAITRHLSAVTIWKPPRLLNDAVITTTVSVTGANLGDTVAVGFSQSVPGGALLVGAVTAPGMVTCTLLNKTGRVLDLAPGSLRADVWQH